MYYNSKRKGVCQIRKRTDPWAVSNTCNTEWKDPGLCQIHKIQNGKTPRLCQKRKDRPYMKYNRGKGIPLGYVSREETYTIVKGELTSV